MGDTKISTNKSSSNMDKKDEQKAENVDSSRDKLSDYAKSNDKNGMLCPKSVRNLMKKSEKTDSSPIHKSSSKSTKKPARTEADNKYFVKKSITQFCDEKRMKITKINKETVEISRSLIKQTKAKPILIYSSKLSELDIVSSAKENKEESSKNKKRKKRHRSKDSHDSNDDSKIQNKKNKKSKKSKKHKNKDSTSEYEDKEKVASAQHEEEKKSEESIVKTESQVPISFLVSYSSDEEETKSKEDNTKNSIKTEDTSNTIEKCKKNDTTQVVADKTNIGSKDTTTIKIENTLSNNSKIEIKLKPTKSPGKSAWDSSDSEYEPDIKKKRLNLPSRSGSKTSHRSKNSKSPILLYNNEEKSKSNEKSKSHSLVRTHSDSRSKSHSKSSSKSVSRSYSSYSDSYSKTDTDYSRSRSRTYSHSRSRSKRRSHRRHRHHHRRHHHHHRRHRHRSSRSRSRSRHRSYTRSSRSYSDSRSRTYSSSYSRSFTTSHSRSSSRTPSDSYRHRCTYNSDRRKRNSQDNSNTKSSKRKVSLKTVNNATVPRQTDINKNISHQIEAVKESQKKAAALSQNMNNLNIPLPPEKPKGNVNTNNNTAKPGPGEWCPSMDFGGPVAKKTKKTANVKNEKTTDSIDLIASQSVIHSNDSVNYIGPQVSQDMAKKLGLDIKSGKKDDTGAKSERTLSDEYSTLDSNQLVLQNLAYQHRMQQQQQSQNPNKSFLSASSSVPSGGISTSIPTSQHELASAVAGHYYQPFYVTPTSFANHINASALGVTTSEHLQAQAAMQRMMSSTVAGSVGNTHLTYATPSIVATPSLSGNAAAAVAALQANSLGASASTSSSGSGGATLVANTPSGLIPISLLQQGNLPVGINPLVLQQLQQAALNSQLSQSVSLPNQSAYLSGIHPLVLHASNQQALMQQLGINAQHQQLMGSSLNSQHPLLMAAAVAQQQQQQAAVAAAVAQQQHQQQQAQAVHAQQQQAQAQVQQQQLLAIQAAQLQAAQIQAAQQIQAHIQAQARVASLHNLQQAAQMQNTAQNAATSSAGAGGSTITTTVASPTNTPNSQTPVHEIGNGSIDTSNITNVSVSDNPESINTNVSVTETMDTNAKNEINISNNNNISSEVINPISSNNISSFTGNPIVSNNTITNADNSNTANPNQSISIPNNFPQHYQHHYINHHHHHPHSFTDAINSQVVKQAPRIIYNTNNSATTSTNNLQQTPSNTIKKT